jgi:hypothetical protein
VLSPTARLADFVQRSRKEERKTDLRFILKQSSDSRTNPLQKGFPMNEIPDVAALLLFGGAFTALAVGVEILLAESWFQKMRQKREHFKI